MQLAFESNDLNADFTMRKNKNGFLYVQVTFYSYILVALNGSMSMHDASHTIACISTNNFSHIFDTAQNKKR